MPPKPLTVIPDPVRTRSTLLRGGEGTVVFRGASTSPVYTCGGCGAPLIEGVEGTHLVDLVLACNACGAFNESPATDTAHLNPSRVGGPVMFPPGRYELTDEMDVQEGFVMAMCRRSVSPAPARSMSMTLTCDASPPPMRVISATYHAHHMSSAANATGP